MRNDILFVFLLSFSILGKVQLAPRSAASIGLIGDPNDVRTNTTGATVLVGGGTDVDEVYRWMIKKSGGGDFVVLRATGTAAYNDYIYQLGSINSVETLLIDSRDLANDPLVERTILDAEALFIAGGDQANYVRFWKGTKVQNALNYLRNVKMIPLGGTSAGCAILGGSYFGALNDTITSVDAMKNPYDYRVTLGRLDFLNTPFLTNVITDTHFDNRNRQGRLMAFLARMRVDHGILPYGIGLDESTAVCIEPNGVGRVIGTGFAYFLYQNGEENYPETCLPNTRLEWNRSSKAVRVYKVRATLEGSGYVDLNRWTTALGGVHLFYSVRNGILNTSV